MRLPSLGETPSLWVFPYRSETMALGELFKRVETQMTQMTQMDTDVTDESE